MDVGYMEFRNGGEDVCGYCEDYDVDMVGKAGIQCYKCGGFGHIARECTIKGYGKGGDKGAGKGGSEKGFGKGGKAYSKGGYKGQYEKGYGKGGNGKGYGEKGFGKGGKGYQGRCWKCNMVGHKAAECTVRINEMENSQDNKDESQIGSVDIGRIWSVCQVEVGGGIPTSNMFGALEEDEEEEWPGLKVEDCTGLNKIDTPKKRFKKIAKKDWVRMEREDEVDGTWIQLLETDNKDALRMKLGFQVAEVSKPLVAVKRIVEKGNLVQFGPNEDDNFIKNMNTGDKIKLRMNGRGSYLMDVNFVGGEKTEITVDSGAEENVCPWDWGRQFGMRPADKYLNFRNASGGWIEHFGSRDVVVGSSF